MDPITQQQALAAAGAGGGALYVEDLFASKLYEGNNYTTEICTGVDMTKGGLVITKWLGGSDNWYWQDTERGVSKFIRSNTLAAEGTDTTMIQSFTNRGYNVGTNGSADPTNENGREYLSYTFRKQKKFFDIVKYTGNNQAGHTISHNLGCVPGCIIIKNITNGTNWAVYHKGFNGGSNPHNYKMTLNTQSPMGGDNWWNYTAPTSTSFQVGTDGVNNYASNEYIAYLFADSEPAFGANEDEPIIKCGYYTGDGSTGGTKKINVGFEPEFVMIRNTDTAVENWCVFDNNRGIGYDSTSTVFFNETQSESKTGRHIYQFYSMGFTLSKNNTDTNASGDRYIYIAVGNKALRARDTAAEQFNHIVWLGNGSIGKKVTAGIKYDLALIKDYNFGYNWVWTDKNRGPENQQLQWDGQAINGTNYIKRFDIQEGGTNCSMSHRVTLGSAANVNSNSVGYLGFFLRRALGFFDIRTYKGSGGAVSLGHKLGVTPELIFVKNMDLTNKDWMVDCPGLSTDYKYVKMNTGEAEQHESVQIWGTHTSTTVRLASGYSHINDSNGYFAMYMFATKAGVSKVGSYTGNGQDGRTIDCGFTNGARFIMIKRIDSAGGWYVFSNHLNIISGNDYWVQLNSANSMNTGTDYVDPDSSGFQVNNHADINDNGGTYTFMAIA